MARISKFDEFINEAKKTDSFVQELMLKFDLSNGDANTLNGIIEEVLSMDDLEEKMDYVESLSLMSEMDVDDDKEQDIIQYIKDNFVI